jgi:hypothetical protein
MNRISISLFTLVAATLLLGSGCGARRVTDFTVISTKNTMLVAKADKRERRITGEDCTMTLVGVPNMKSAIDDALNKAGPEYDALVDGVIYMDDKILFQCYRVEGTPLKAKKAPAEYTKEFGPTGAVQTDKGNTFVERRRAAEPTPKAEPAPRVPPAPAPVVAPVEEAPDTTAPEVAERGDDNELYDAEEDNDDVGVDDDSRYVR